ncbi:MAG: hypothetical protein V1740_04550 [Candidatus Woesearchaeota archaeon]
MQTRSRFYRAVGIAALCASALISCNNRREVTRIPEPEDFGTVAEQKSEYITGMVVHAGKNEYDRKIIEVWVQTDDATYHLAVTEGRYLNFNLLNGEGVEGRTVIFPKNEVYWDSTKGEVVTRPYFVNDGHYGTICSDCLKIVDPLGDDISDQLAKKS